MIMASPKLGKRARRDESDDADNISQEGRLVKKPKPNPTLDESRNFPPEFWNNLSRVPLTRRALRELDRRNIAPAAHPTDLSLPTRAGSGNSAYDQAFEEHLCDNNVYLHNPKSRPSVIPDLNYYIQTTASLSLSDLLPTNDTFRQFRHDHLDPGRKADFMRKILPYLCGRDHGVP
jgi:hypothetical protein